MAAIIIANEINMASIVLQFVYPRSARIFRSQSLDTYIFICKILDRLIGSGKSMNFTNKSKIVIFLFLKVDLDNRILISSQNSDLQFSTSSTTRPKRKRPWAGVGLLQMSSSFRRDLRYSKVRNRTMYTIFTLFIGF